MPPCGRLLCKLREYPECKENPAACPRYHLFAQMSPEEEAQLRERLLVRHDTIPPMAETSGRTV